jgi:hypothetical protein
MSRLPIRAEFTLNGLGLGAVHHQGIVDGFVRGVTRINYGVSEHMIDEGAARSRGTKCTMKIVAHKSLRK